MPPDEPLTNGADPPEARQTLREIAEAAYDEVQGNNPEDAGADDAGQDGQRRDSLGRFASKDAKPGEQSEDPAPKENSDASGDAKPDPAPDAGSSSQQPPQHWSEQDRQTFAKLPKEGQDFLLRRHSEMERDYSTKTQANAVAVQFTQALAPIFQDPVMAGSLQQAKLSPFEAIGQWAGFHRRAMDPNIEVRRALHRELGERMGLDPAAAGQMSQHGPGQLSEADLKDPAIRYFADYIGKTQSGMEALRAELTQMKTASEEAQAREVLKATRWSIDSFADEKDAQGNLKRPHFDAVLPTMIEFYRANPERDLQEAYDMAVWATPAVREKLIAADRQSVEAQRSNERARQAVRSNVRGITSPVSKPAGDGKPKGLRATIEAAADEAGI